MSTHRYQCYKCQNITSFTPEDKPNETCHCGGRLVKTSTGTMSLGHDYPLWVDKMDDIHKEQEDRGERLRIVHPSEIL